MILFLLVLPLKIRRIFFKNLCLYPITYIFQPFRTSVINMEPLNENVRSFLQFSFLLGFVGKDTFSFYSPTKVFAYKMQNYGMVVQPAGNYAKVSNIYVFIDVCGKVLIVFGHIYTNCCLMVFHSLNNVCKHVRLKINGNSYS